MNFPITKKTTPPNSNNESYYKTNFLMEFKNSKLDGLFSRFYFSNQHFLIEIYLVSLIFLMVVLYILSNSFDNNSDVIFRFKNKYLYVISLFFLIYALFFIKNSSKFLKNPIFIRICLLFGSLYIYTCLIRLDVVPEVIWMSIAILISASNFVIFMTWKSHLFFSMLTLLIIYYYLYFFDVLLYKLFILDWIIGLEIMIFSLFMVAMKEKMYKEVWILTDSYRRSERNLEKFIEDLPVPIMVIDSNKNIILLNRYCTVLIDSLENSVRNKEFIKSFLHRNLDDFLNEKDIESLDSMISGSLAKQVAFSRIFVLEEIQKKMYCSKDSKDSKDDEQKKMRKIISDLSEYCEDSNLYSHLIYEITTSAVISS